MPRTLAETPPSSPVYRIHVGVPGGSTPSWHDVCVAFRPVDCLGSAGDGFYGTLTEGSMGIIFRELVALAAGRGWGFFDIGAFNGKLLLGALAHGASYACGIEVKPDVGGSLSSVLHAKARELGVGLDRVAVQWGTDVRNLPGKQPLPTPRHMAAACWVAYSFDVGFTADDRYWALALIAHDVRFI